MSVVGVVILITLLLILKLITQAASTPPAATVSARELQNQIETLSPVLQEIQNEIEQQQKQKLDSIITPQTQNQINTLITTIKRINAECIEIEKEIQNTKRRSEVLKNDLKSKKLPDNENQIKQMKEQLNQLKSEMDELAKQEKKLQEIVDELVAKKQESPKETVVTITQQINVTIQKKPDKTAFLCVYGADGITVIPTNGSPQKNFKVQSEFYQWIDSRNNKTDHFIIYFRPSRFKRYKELLDALKGKNFDVGYQVIGETTDLINNN
jgi:prefoldin subunit 5